MQIYTVVDAADIDTAGDKNGANILGLLEIFMINHHSLKAINEWRFPTDEIKVRFGEKETPKKK